MSASNIAAAAAAGKQAEVQLAVAAKIAKQNNQAEAAVADLVEAANQNLQKLVSAAPAGTGQIVDIQV